MLRDWTLKCRPFLKEQFVKVFSMMKPGILFQCEQELDAFLEFLIWRFSIWVDKPTPGNALMNLRYRDERAVEVRGKGHIALINGRASGSDMRRMISMPYLSNKASSAPICGLNDCQDRVGGAWTHCCTEDLVLCSHCWWSVYLGPSSVVFCFS